MGKKRSHKLEANDCYGVEYASGTRKIIPRISCILASSESKKSRERLAKWRDENPEKAIAVQERGTSLHFCIEEHFSCGYVSEVPPDVAEFWSVLDPFLDQAQNPTWVEGHTQQDLNFLFSREDNERPFAGTPDLNLEFRGIDTIVDIKTSTTLYHRLKPIPTDYTMFDNPNHPDRNWYFEQFYGWKRWAKVKLQLTAYSNLWKGLFGKAPSKLAVWVAYVPDRESEYYDPNSSNAVARPQLFIMNQQERYDAMLAWNNLLEEFYSRPLELPTWENLIQEQRPIQVVNI